MELLSHGSAVLLGNGNIDDISITFDGEAVDINLILDGSLIGKLQATEVLSFRFTYEASYEGYIEGSHNRVFVLSQPSWRLRYFEDDSPQGKYASTRKFFHINIPDIGIFECWAESVIRIPISA